MKKKNFRWLKILLGIIIAIILAVVIFFGVLTVTEYKPAAEEKQKVTGANSAPIKEGDSFDIMTWNVGYGGLGETADFFMDGGKGVQSSTEDMVNDNLAAFSSTIATVQPDVVFLQEVDVNSKRTYHINELESLAEALPEYNYSNALNYSCLYVPYPLPTIGQVNSGVATLSKYAVTDATRVQLPIPFKYPVRLANLKRCLLVNRIPLKGSGKELVLINLHLEAYDSGEGKAAQTKQLRDLMLAESKKGNYVIAGGDFNQSFSNYDNSAYPFVSEEMWQPGAIETSDFGDSLTLVTDNSAPTCRSLDKPLKGADTDPSKFQYYVIDGFIVSDNLTVNTVKNLDLAFKNSDHNPIMMNVTLNK